MGLPTSADPLSVWCLAFDVTDRNLPPSERSQQVSNVLTEWIAEDPERMAAFKHDLASVG